MKKLTCKQFWGYDKLCDFVNNHLLDSDVLTITETANSYRLWYWTTPEPTEKHTKPAKS